VSRKFKFNNSMESTKKKMYFRAKYGTEAYAENDGIGPIMTKDFNFLELQNYGLIDNENYSIIPRTEYLVNINESDPQSPRVFDFVADALALMKMNFAIAANKGLIAREGVFQDFTIIEAYSNPKIKYDNYMANFLKSFNNYFIREEIGIDNITSYYDYVKNFINLVESHSKNVPVTLSRFNKSTDSSVLDSGLAVKYFEIGYDDDQTKIDAIIDQPSFDYFKNLCLNFGFSISHNNPNILVYDVASPASQTLLRNRQILGLNSLFRSRYTRTYFDDINRLINNINIYYNRFVLLNPKYKKFYTVCNKTYFDTIDRQPVDLLFRPSDNFLLDMYARIRNGEEDLIYSDKKIKQIIKKAKYLNKKLDIDNAMGYISNVFKDQVWNKDYGYHDLLQKINESPYAQSGRRIRGQGETTSSPQSDSSPTGGTTSGY